MYHGTTTLSMAWWLGRAQSLQRCRGDMGGLGGRGRQRRFLNSPVRVGERGKRERNNNNMELLSVGNH